MTARASFCTFFQLICKESFACMALFGPETDDGKGKFLCYTETRAGSPENIPQPGRAWRRQVWGGLYPLNFAARRSGFKIFCSP